MSEIARTSEPNRDKPNPSADEVISILLVEMQGGARPRNISDVFGRDILERYRESIEDRLREGKWPREGKAVRNAARQLGIIAGAVASLHRADDVEASWLEAAARLTEDHCGIDNAGIQPGRWCGRTSVVPI